MREERLRKVDLISVAMVTVVCSLAGSKPAEAKTCFRGRSLPECKTFWITEFGYSRRFNLQPSHYPDNRPNDFLNWELGGMTNINRRSALGATLFGGFNVGGSYFGYGSRIGLKPRFRLWLNPTTNLDLSPGIILYGDFNSFKPKFPGFTGQVGLNLRDWFALTSHLEIVRLETVGTDVVWYNGVKLGSYPGVFTGVAAIVASGVILRNISSFEGF